MKKNLFFLLPNGAVLSLLLLLCACTSTQNERPDPDASLIISQQGESYYTLEYNADYNLDKLLQEGSTSQKDIAGFTRRHFALDREFRLSAPDKKLPLRNLKGSVFLGKMADDSSLVGRNMDYGDKHCVMTLKTNPSNGYKSVSGIDLSLLGIHSESVDMNSPSVRKKLLAAPYLILDGMNEKGFFICALSVPDAVEQNTDKPEIYGTVLIRAVLDKCATLDEAVALIQNYDMFFSDSKVGIHLFLADASGKSAVLEYIGGKLYVNNNSFVTNFYITPDADKGNGDGYDRYAMLESAMRVTKGVFTRKQAMRLLSAVAVTDDPEWMTQWSLVCFLNTFSGKISIHRNYRKQYDVALPFPVEK